MTKNTFTNLLFMIATSFISAQQTYDIDANTNTQSTSIFNKNENKIKVSAKTLINPKTALINSVELLNISIDYKMTNYNYAEQLNSFNRIAYNIGIEHEFSSKTKLNFNFNPAAGFQKDFGASDIILLGGLEIEYHFNPKNFLKLGIQRNTIFGKTQILPTITFHHQVNQKLSIDAGFPSTSFSYSNNARNQFIYTTSFSGSSYNIDQSPFSNKLTTLSKVEFSNLNTQLEYERNVDSNWYLNLKGGYDFNKKFIAIDQKNNLLNDLNNSKGYILSFGIKYKL
ncbi:DUF6268 family outer membrane beta-barrel protein [Flavobacterium ovatum]|uniref:DUF6268 family outer membrane beta-barrel protein n=1 Tax=Flavobacterium ovatum TaxID=1928857 RepID=UPI00344C2462